MLCEVGESFFLTWFVMTGLAVVSVFLLSGPLFYLYYWPSQVTYEKWRMKSNPKFPSPTKVRDEIVQMLKGVGTAALCPTLALYLSKHGLSQAYCGVEPHGYGHLAFTFMVVWLGNDLWSWAYHRLGHEWSRAWAVHRHHHVFFNPSPFAVIADEYTDQLFRAGLSFVLPLLMPVNIDLLFAEFAVFFYLYGVYLHWGYELTWPDAHHPVLNTAFQHYCHHAKAILGKPYHCGFYFKIWDQLFGGMYPKERCFCVKCEQAKGLRSREAFQKVVVPDYSVLLKPAFWMQRSALSGNSASDSNEVLSKEEQFFEKAKQG